MKSGTGSASSSSAEPPLCGFKVRKVNLQYLLLTLALVGWFLGLGVVFCRNLQKDGCCSSRPFQEQSEVLKVTYLEINCKCIYCILFGQDCSACPSKQRAL